MTDIMTKSQRSFRMSLIRDKNTKIEVLLRKELFKRGFRFRKNLRHIVGKPDIVLSKYKTVIFVNGCFWHHHKDCKLAQTPKGRKDYWLKKFNDNQKRDQEQIDELINDGWHVLVIWECEIRHNLIGCADELEKIIHYILPSLSKRLFLPSLSCFIHKT